jgi:alkaline phosphatase D
MNVLKLRRRDVVLGAAGALAVSAVSTMRGIRSWAQPPVEAIASAAPVEPLPTGLTRTWLGPSYWANRLEDFRLANGRIECLGTMRLRSVAVLTREINNVAAAATLSVRTGTLAAGAGFSGFLIGGGGGSIDYRAAALVQSAAGTGGGLLCVYENDGQVRFRNHTNETNQLTYAVRPASALSGPAPARRTAEDVTLTLSIAPESTGNFTLTLTVRNTATATLLHTARLTGVLGSAIAGGISLVSAPLSGSTARYWLRDVDTQGAKVTNRPERALGPIVGTLFSLNRATLKMTAQLMPIGAAEDQTARLQVLNATGGWNTVATATLGAGFTAAFRVGNWDSSRSWTYRVVWGLGTAREHAWGGTIPQDEVSKATIRVGVVNCVIHSYRPLDQASSGAPTLPGATALGLYTEGSLYFPYTALVNNLRRQQPDLLVAQGDQFYENRPTAAVPPTNENPTMNFLYRYYLWLWAFRDLTRDRPTIVMVDDHDVYQGNLWGHGGAAAPNNDQNAGGYVKSATFVNVVQRVQTGHNPDPHDPTPVAQGITVSYGAFTFGGVSFAFLEDRKFKWATGSGGPGGSTPDNQLPILGARQEALLTDWAAMHPGQPKVCLTQTAFAGVQTTPDRQPRREADTASYPVARRRALQLIKNAGAVVVSGDQHLSFVVRHGLDTFSDGPVQFVAPAGGTSYQRWFEAQNLANPESTPNTGDFTDAWGNRVHVLAVANPRVTLAQVNAATPGRQDVGDRSLKREGYGVVAINKTTREFILEAWPWQLDPTSSTSRPFPGWPVRVPFSAA